jgi:hypothetical protein
MATKRAKRINKIDEEVEETFPASDPPAFMAGSIGAPPRRAAKKPVKKAAKRDARRKVPKTPKKKQRK